MSFLRLKKEHIPNFITVIRIILIPIYVLSFFGVITVGEKSTSLVTAGTFFVIAGLSDALDGFLARRNHWVTDIGKLLDPFADKLLEVAVTVCLAFKFKGPFVILAAIIITKEILMIVGAYLIMKKSQFYVSAGWCGKVATVVWYVLILAVHFVPISNEGNVLFFDSLCIVLILVMLMAFFLYVLKYAQQIESTKEAIIKDKNIK